MSEFLKKLLRRKAPPAGHVRVVEPLSKEKEKIVELAVKRTIGEYGDVLVKLAHD